MPLKSTSFQAFLRRNMRGTTVESLKDILGQLRAAPSGIAEYHCWYGNQEKHLRENPELLADPFPEDQPTLAIDQCIDLHVEHGYTNLIWACARSVVHYKSDLPHATFTGDLAEAGQAKSSHCCRKVLKQVCPLRHCLEYSGQRDVVVWGRVAMNRHYGAKGWMAATSRFSLDHPDCHEISRAGQWVNSRLCYALPEVKQERLDILLEIQRIGAQGLVLDFCRQMPHVGYHPAVLEPYMQQTGEDPRVIDSTDPAEHLRWFQYRADIMTGFMRKLREAVRQQERTLGRWCPIIARVPDSPRWLMLGYALDIETWAAEDLIDGTMLSPFPHTREAMEFDTPFQVQAMHRHGKLCIGGVGSKGLLAQPDDPQALTAKACRLAHEQYQAGVDGMSLYQSETTLRMPHLQELSAKLGDRQAVAAAASDEPYVGGDDKAGCDWHSMGQGIPAFGDNPSAL
jgi:hypothetical protein